MEQFGTIKKVIVLLSITSDIGAALAERYSKQGHMIIGTYRSNNNLEKLKSLPHCQLFFCDIQNKESIKELIQRFKDLNLNWDLFISCVGTQKPIGKFFNCDFDQWDSSIHINAINQLRLLHSLYPYKNRNKNSNVIFFAGGGTNSAIKNYSAYTLSKIMLIKMCELIDFENEELNIAIIGPGWVKTKIHNETLNEKKENVGESYEKTLKFRDEEQGTSMDDIFNCIEWLCQQGKDVVSGRNFSVVHDKWANGGEKLAKILKSNTNIYKLRRFGNECVI